MATKRPRVASPRNTNPEHLEKIVLEFGGIVRCPYCQEEIANSEAEEAHGVCEHLVGIHLVNFQEDGLDFGGDDGFVSWWGEQPWDDLYECRDDDSNSVSAFGEKALAPEFVRVLRTYEACPLIDCLIAQEDQGGGPCCGSIGPVLFGFRKPPGDVPENSAVKL